VHWLCKLFIVRWVFSIKVLFFSKPAIFPSLFHRLPIMKLSSRLICMTIVFLCLLARSLGPASGADAARIQMSVQPLLETWVPGEIIFDGDTVYLLQADSTEVQRWSVGQWRFLDAFHLQAVPYRVLFSPTHVRLYVGYPDGKITAIHPSGAPVEMDFAHTQHGLCGLGDAGAFLVACIPYNPQLAYRQVSYTASGTQAGTSPNGVAFPSYTWNESQSCQYFTNAKSGLFRQEIDSLTGAIIHPFLYAGDKDQVNFIRVFPGGDKILISAGLILDGMDFHQLGNLPTQPIRDAAWLDGTLYTLSYNTGVSALQKWDAEYHLLQQSQPAAAPLRLFSTPHGLLTVSNVGGKPYFMLWDADLKLLAQSNYSIYLPLLSRE
jgi:hypothetical protein